MNPNRRNSHFKNRRQSAGGKATVRPSFGEWLAVKLDVPADVAEGGIRLDLRGRSSLTVHGCRRILDFSPQSICLLLTGCTLTVRGQRLICTAYLAGAVGIEGCICAVEFHDGGDGE